MPPGRESSLRIVVLGHIVRGPVGGMAWHHLQYVLGLARLGHDVLFLEDSQDHPACYDPDRDVTGDDPSYGLRFAQAAFSLVGLADRWAYHDARSSTWLGPAGDRALDFCASADVLLNMSGKNPLRAWFADIPHRALIDTDPAFTQLRHIEDAAARQQAAGHTAFLTFGENLPAGRSRIPDDGFAWRSTRQPVVLDQWPVTPPPAAGKLTTVMLWDSYASRTHGGVRYGMKSESFAPYLDLPQRAGRVFELAAGSPSLPKASLRDHGWTLLDPLAVTRSLDDYRRFLQGSRAEFSVAKHGYVVSNSGWFSERSAAYLASGRPVIVQDTGFTSWLPESGGVLPFRDVDGALAAIDALATGYDRRCREARETAAACFDARVVLPRLLRDIEDGR